MTLAKLRGELRQAVALRDYTSWKVGGPAHQLYRPRDLEDLAAFLRQLPEQEPLLWLGLGSNLLVSDEGFAGTVILTQGTLGQISRQGDTGIVAEVGISSPKLARDSVALGLTGLEFLVGIPGTLGGALALNAGAHGHELWSRVRRVTLLDRQGLLHQRGPEDFCIGYREVRRPDHEWFVAAELQLETGDPQRSREQMKAWLRRRNSTQPIGEPSCGSVFRNPPGDHAARLIEAAGLKGLRIGDAEVSTRHANFIVNRGQARARDIAALMREVQRQVHEHFAIDLIPEVHRVGTGWTDEHE